MATTATLTGVERMRRILQRKPADRIGLFEHFWGDCEKKWRQEGHVREDETLHDHFGFDMEDLWPFKYVARTDFVPEIVEEDEETQLVRDGNGALLRRHKLHDATPEHVDFLVQDRAGWEAHVKPFLVAGRNRIGFEAYRAAKQRCAAANRFFCWSGVNSFECIHPVCGHQHMLMGMAMDPAWVKEMADTYARLNIELMEILFAEEGEPDGIWFYEDMGMKQRPFFSLEMYREILQPAHRKTIEFAHGRGLPVIMHSCGFVEPLLPGMIEAGIDCLQVIEVKAGMDLLRIYRDYGDRLSLMGGIDVRVLYTNDRAAVDKELDATIPIVKGGFGYTLHSDHSIPDQVEYETYRYFVERGMALGRTDRALGKES